jgi:hypothetical protein
VKRPLTKRNFHTEGIAKTSNRPSAFFVADHLALEFLNTTSTPGEVRIELLGHGNDLVRLAGPGGGNRSLACGKGRESDRGVTPVRNRLHCALRCDRPLDASHFGQPAPVRHADAPSGIASGQMGVR